MSEESCKTEGKMGSGGEEADVYRWPARREFLFVTQKANDALQSVPLYLQCSVVTSSNRGG